MHAWLWVQIPAVWPWVSYRTSLRIGILRCHVGVMTGSGSQDSCEDRRKGFEVGTPGPHSCRVHKSEQLFKPPDGATCHGGWAVATVPACRCSRLVQSPSPEQKQPGHTSNPREQHRGCGGTSRVVLRKTLTPLLLGDALCGCHVVGYHLEREAGRGADSQQGPSPRSGSLQGTACWNGRSSAVGPLPGQPQVGRSLATS